MAQADAVTAGELSAVAYLLRETRTTDRSSNFPDTISTSPDDESSRWPITVLKHLEEKTVTLGSDNILLTMARH